MYKAIDRLIGKGIGNVSLLCRVANVSRKNYYRHLKYPYDENNKEILEEIRNLQENHKGSIGYRPMTELVSKKCGKQLNSKRIRRLMKDNNLLSAVRRKKYSDEVYTKRREMKEHVPADLIKRDFFALTPRKRMLEDITYLPGLEKTMYLNTIEDLYNGEILAYCISDSPNAKLCADTITILCEKWGECFRGSIIHNDLGSSYVSYEYSAAVKAHGIRQSIGRVATCYDNAPMESLNGIIKTEALYCRFGKTKVKEKRVPIADILEAVQSFIPYYNSERPKAYNGGLSPIEFRLQNPTGTYLIPINSEGT
ncbi:MAG: IS3 family transposase [Butyrivibrio sp.]|nr:IS3 family transposase [Butyrivibrio sp.]